jgi:hypothetical protein
MGKTEDDSFFSLLVNISASSESSIERLSTSLKVFVKKYFDNKDFSVPSSPLEIAMNCIMRIEAILYTIYELEPMADTEDSKIELLYYKDLVLKSLVVLTNIDFFVKVLKDNNLFKDAYELREKVKSEFRMEAANLNQNVETGDFLNLDIIKFNTFKDIKPTEYRRNVNKKEILPETKPLSDNEQEIISGLKSKKFKALAELKKRVVNKDREQKKQTDKDGKKIIRTSMGWEIPSDFFDDKD